MQTAACFVLHADHRVVFIFPVNHKSNAEDKTTILSLTSGGRRRLLFIHNKQASVNLFYASPASWFRITCGYFAILKHELFKRRLEFAFQRSERVSTSKNRVVAPTHTRPCTYDALQRRNPIFTLCVPLEICAAGEKNKSSRNRTGRISRALGAGQPHDPIQQDIQKQSDASRRRRASTLVTAGIPH